MDAERAALERLKTTPPPFDFTGDKASPPAQRFGTEPRNTVWAEPSEKRLLAKLQDMKAAKETGAELGVTCKSSVCQIVFLLPEAYLDKSDQIYVAYAAFVQAVVETEGFSKKPLFAISGMAMVAYTVV